MTVKEGCRYMLCACLLFWAFEVKEYLDVEAAPACKAFAAGQGADAHTCADQARARAATHTGYCSTMPLLSALRWTRRT